MPLIAVMAVKFAWPPLGWALLGIFLCLGILALVSPASFTRVANHGGKWIDTQHLLAKLDRRIDIDKYVLPHSRLLGALVIASVGVLALVLTRR